MIKLKSDVCFKTVPDEINPDIFDKLSCPDFKQNDVISFNNCFYLFKKDKFIATEEKYAEKISEDHTFLYYFKAAVIVMSDSCSQGIAEDKSGEFLKNRLLNQGYIVEDFIIVPDDFNEIEKVLNNCIKKNISLVLTTGGTGLSPRDVTPDVTKKVASKEIPGISQAIINYSLTKSPHAMFGRIYSGFCGRTLFINLPGSVKAVKECAEILFPENKNILFHALEKLAAVMAKCGS
ncbi:MAG: MogA/MoaB family molybdenum cofactor biosynthesis protein [Candidatus Muiribacteriota bacterium]|jgi:molybdenum cofactor synthesis domain-containing protein